MHCKLKMDVIIFKMLNVTTKILEWKFLRGGGGGANKKPSVGGVWIFSGTAQFAPDREGGPRSRTW